jgi:adenine-specific DNA-methyltransferase
MRLALMARLEELIATIKDPVLRDAVAHEVKTLKSRAAFGLVFERHLPEHVLLPPASGVAVGDRVKRREAPGDQRELRVVARSNGQAVVVDGEGDQGEVPVDELLVERGFGESVYPTLTPLGRVERSAKRPYHAVVNGENYHALQVMPHCWAGQVDCIYADPPYNTGARDWKYNNDYVEGTDSWRHSKWLSMMEKRLRLAKKLLKPAGPAYPHRGGGHKPSGRSAQHHRCARHYRGLDGRTIRGS